jgi:hypothetical protein
MRRIFARFAALPAVLALLVASSAVPAFAAPGEFAVVNNTSFSIVSLYVGSSDSDTWGDDLLAGQVMNPAQTATVTLYAFDGTTCFYDVLVVGPLGQKGVMSKFDLCNLNTVTFSDA